MNDMLRYAKNTQYIYMSLKKSLFLAETLPVIVEEPTCRINISGYSLKNYKMFNP